MPQSPKTAMILFRLHIATKFVKLPLNEFGHVIMKEYSQLSEKGFSFSSYISV